MHLADCDPARDGQALRAIINDAIETSTALYDYHPRSLAQVTQWAQDKRVGQWPLRGAFDQHEQLIGFATFGPFRPQPAYKYTVEHSVYVHRAHQRQGVALALMNDLLLQAQARECHVMIGCIDAENLPSVSLHRKLGFTHSGTLTQAGFKFGRWLDAAFYQKTLAGPAQPLDG
jgi:phosphinothricin acetyltransferase